MAWMPCHCNHGEYCHPASCHRCHDDCGCRDPATWSCCNNTSQAVCCDGSHLRNIIPSPVGPSHCTFYEVCDASCVSHFVQYGIRVSLPGNHLQRPVSWRCYQNTRLATWASHQEDVDRFPRTLPCLPYGKTCKTIQAVMLGWTDACLLLGELPPSKSSLQIGKDVSWGTASLVSGRCDLHQVAYRCTAYP